MTILIASDSFKDACSSLEACNAIARGIQTARPEMNVLMCPISDGGEGTLQILQQQTDGVLQRIKVNGPLFSKTLASFLILNDQTAVIEMAQASGLELLEKAERNPMNTSTFGTGELIRAALENGCKEIIITVGGSASNDLGMGMASALGYQFLDKNGISLAPIGANMVEVVHIDTANVLPELKKINFQVITDVNNPLYGEDGAAKVFAHQKGASKTEIKLLDQGLIHLAGVIEKDLGVSLEYIKGAGAAGGLAGGCVAFLGAKINLGFDMISNLIDLEAKIRNVDLVITGEGRLDEQTKGGKVIQGLSAIAARMQKPVIVFCGQSDIGDNDVKEMGIQEVIQISEINSDFDLEVALIQTIVNLEDKAFTWAKKCR